MNAESSFSGSLLSLLLTGHPCGLGVCVCSALCLDICEFHLYLNGRGREDRFVEAEGARIDGKSDDVAVK